MWRGGGGTRVAQPGTAGTVSIGLLQTLRARSGAPAPRPAGRPVRLAVFSCSGCRQGLVPRETAADSTEGPGDRVSRRAGPLVAGGPDLRCAAAGWHSGACAAADGTAAAAGVVRQAVQHRQAMLDAASNSRLKREATSEELSSCMVAG